MATSPLVGPTEVDQMLLRLQDRLNVLEQTAILAPGIVAWCATVCPDGWLVCDGSTISATRYGQLVARLQSTTLPNLQGRVVVGQDAATFAAMLATGGVETVTLTGAQSGTPGFSGNTGADTPDHHHSSGSGLSFVVSGGGGPNGLSGAPASFAAFDTVTSGRSATHTHSITVPAAAAASAHTNLQPFIVLLPIIKF